MYCLMPKGLLPMSPPQLCCNTMLIDMGEISLLDVRM